METFTYILLVHQIIGLTLSSAATYFSGTLIFRIKSSQISLLLKLHFCYAFIYSFVNICYHGYMFIFWNPTVTHYDARILFILGGIPFNMMFLNGVIEACICLERCFYIVFPLSYKKSHRFAYTLGVFLILIGVFAAALDIMGIYGSIPQKPETTCRFYSCLILVKPLANYFRIFIVISDIIAAGILALLVKCTMIVNSVVVKKLNKMVLILVTCTTMIELIPVGAAQVFLVVTGLQPQAYFGPYGFTGSTVTITLSSFVYFRTFKRLNRSLKPTRVVPLTNTNTRSTNNNNLC